MASVTTIPHEACMALLYRVRYVGLNVLPAALPMQVTPSRCTTPAPWMTAACLTRRGAASHSSLSSELERCVNREVVREAGLIRGVRRGSGRRGEEGLVNERNL